MTCVGVTRCVVLVTLSGHVIWFVNELSIRQETLFLPRDRLPGGWVDGWTREPIDRHTEKDGNVFNTKTDKNKRCASYDDQNDETNYT